MIQLRDALAEDAEELTMLARRSKAHWGYPQEWLDAWEDDLKFEPEFIEANTVVVAQLDGAMVGVFALEILADHVELEHFWILPEMMGQGLGRTCLRKPCYAVKPSKVPGSGFCQIPMPNVST